jgi:hypothetical protein
MKAEDRTYQHSELNRAIRRNIKSKEKLLNRTCRKVWSFTNPKGIQFLFGSFCRNRDRLFVTMGHFEKSINDFYPEY